MWVKKSQCCMQKTEVRTLTSHSTSTFLVYMWMDTHKYVTVHIDNELLGGVYNTSTDVASGF